MISTGNSDSESEVVSSVPLSKIPRGRYKSGRIWKDERDRFRSLVQGKPLKKTSIKRKRERTERTEVLTLSNAVKEEKRERKEALRERQKLNKERRLANERKAEIVQVIKDTKKLKKLSRKQMKYIQTRDTTKLLNKEKT